MNGQKIFLTGAYLRPNTPQPLADNTESFPLVLPLANTRTEFWELEGSEPSSYILIRAWSFDVFIL